MQLHIVDLIAENIQKTELPCKPVIGICAVTGQESYCVPFSKLFGKSFTNNDILVAPESGMVSVNAYYVLKYKWERMSSWIALKSEFIRLGKIIDGDNWRKKILNYVFNPPQEMWGAYITISYKKHGALFAPVNIDKNIWLFETILVDCTDREKVAEYWQILNTVLRQGIGRTIMESLQCPPFVLKKIGVKTWMEFERWAKEKYHSPLYKFLCYLLPTQEELKNESV